MTPQPKLKDGVKYDQQKRRFSLFPTRTLYAIIDVLEYGAKKYEEENWRKVPDARKRYYDAAMRHINDWWLGETHDTGVCHMAPFTDPDGNVLMLHRRYAPRG